MVQLQLPSLTRASHVVLLLVAMAQYMSTNALSIFLVRVLLWSPARLTWFWSLHSVVFFVVPLIGLCSDALQNRFDSSSLLLAQSKDKTMEQAIGLPQFSTHSTLSDGDAHKARHPRPQATWRTSTVSGVGMSLRRRMAQMIERGAHRWEQLAVVVGMLLLCQTSLLLFMPEPPGSAVNFNNNTDEKSIHYDHHGSTSSSFWFVASTIAVSACYLAASVIVNGFVIDAASAPSGSSSRRTTDVASTVIAEGSSHEREALSAAQRPNSEEEKEEDNGSEEAAKNGPASFTRMGADDDCGAQRHSDAQASLMWLRSCGSVLGATTEIVLFYWLPSSSSPSSSSNSNYTASAAAVTTTTTTTTSTGVLFTLCIGLILCAGILLLLERWHSMSRLVGSVPPPSQNTNSYSSRDESDSEKQNNELLEEETVPLSFRLREPSCSDRVAVLTGLVGAMLSWVIFLWEQKGSARRRDPEEVEAARPKESHFDQSIAARYLWASLLFNCVPSHAVALGSLVAVGYAVSPAMLAATSFVGMIASSASVPLYSFLRERFDEQQTRATAPCARRWWWCFESLKRRTSASSSSSSSFQRFMLALLCGTSVAGLCSNLLLLHQDKIQTVVCGKKEGTTPRIEGSECGTTVFACLMFLDAIVSQLASRIWFLPLLTIAALGAVRWNRWYARKPLLLSPSSSFTSSSLKAAHQQNSSLCSQASQEGASMESNSPSLGAARDHDCFDESNAAADTFGPRRSCPTTTKSNRHHDSHSSSSYSATYCEVSSVLGVVGTMLGSWIAIGLYQWFQISVAVFQSTDAVERQLALAQQRQAVTHLMLLCVALKIGTGWGVIQTLLL